MACMLSCGFSLFEKAWCCGVRICLRRVKYLNKKTSLDQTLVLRCADLPPAGQQSDKNDVPGENLGATVCGSASGGSKISTKRRPWRKPWCYPSQAAA